MFGLCCCPEEVEGLCEQGPDPENAHWLLDLSGVVLWPPFSEDSLCHNFPSGTPKLFCTRMNTPATRTLTLFFANPLGTGGTEYAYRFSAAGVSQYILHVFPPGEGPISTTILGTSCDEQDKVPERLTCYLQAIGIDGGSEQLLFFINTDGVWDVCKDSVCCRWQSGGTISLTRVDP